MFEKRKVPLSRRLAVHVAKKAPGRWNERCNVWRSGLGPCAAANVATVNSPLPCARCHAADAPLTRAGRHRLRRLRQVPTRTSGRVAPFSVLARPCSASTSPRLSDFLRPPAFSSLRRRTRLPSPRPHRRRPHPFAPPCTSTWPRHAWHRRGTRSNVSNDAQPTAAPIFRPTLTQARARRAIGAARTSLSPRPPVSLPPRASFLRHLLPTSLDLRH